MKIGNKGVFFFCVFLLCAMLFPLNVFASVEGAPGGVTVVFGDEDKSSAKTEISVPKEEAPAKTEENKEDKADTSLSPDKEEQEKEDGEKHGLVDFVANLKRTGDFLASLANGDLATVYSVLLLIASLAVCFFAYKFVKYCVGLSCFGIGIFATVFVSDKMSLLTSGKSKLICLLCAILIGVIMSAVAYCLPKAGIFFFAGSSAYIILSGIKVPFPLALVIAVLVAIIAALLVRVALIVISSGVGGLLSGALICSFIKALPFAYFHIPLGLILFVLGMTFQFSTKKGKKHRESNRNEQQNN